MPWLRTFMWHLWVATCLGAALGACVSSGLGEADRLFLAGDLAAAESAYREYLASGRTDPAAEALARYRLGLIYALPQSSLHDWRRAEHELRELVARAPESAWAHQAELVLSLHDRSDRLRRELELQQSREIALLEEVSRLGEEARRAGHQIEDREARLERLTDQIAQLRGDIGRLSDQLAASEAELEQIKRIDLQTPP